jgi:hypothetical protein
MVDPALLVKPLTVQLGGYLGPCGEGVRRPIEGSGRLGDAGYNSVHHQITSLDSLPVGPLDLFEAGGVSHSLLLTVPGLSPHHPVVLGRPVLQ